MSILSKLSDRQIREIAERVDAGEMCYIHAGTGEAIFVVDDELSWDDADEEDEMEKIHSWEEKDTIRIKKPKSYEAFKFMERFVNEVIPEGRLKEDFEQALSKKHPFRNFSAIADRCEYQEAWYEFKQNALEAYVREKLDCWDDEEENEEK